MAKGKYAKQEKKKPFYKRTWFIVLVIVILIGSFGNTVEEDTPTEPTEAAVQTVVTTQPTVVETTVSETEAVQTEEKPLELKFGELLDLTIINSIDNIAIVKAKIAPSYSTEATIHQNYHNVVELIRENGFDQYDELQYWAVADMTDGSEQKVISFTLDSAMIDTIANNEYFVPSYLDDCEIDLWLHQSLREE